jgi:hypothetical protein
MAYSLHTKKVRKARKEMKNGWKRKKEVDMERITSEREKVTECNSVKSRGNGNFMFISYMF